jgi:hypothetical protein
MCLRDARLGYCLQTGLAVGIALDLEIMRGCGPRVLTMFDAA